MNIPAFKSHYHVHVFPGEGVLLLSEIGSGALYGRAYELVAPLVDGRRSADEIVDTLAGQVDAATVYYVLTLLESKGYLTEAAPEIPTAAAFWHGMELDPRTALASLQGAHPWLLMRVTGPQLWLGPLFIPGATGCWQ